MPEIAYDASKEARPSTLRYATWVRHPGTTKLLLLGRTNDKDLAERSADIAVFHGPFEYSRVEDTTTGTIVQETES